MGHYLSDIDPDHYQRETARVSHYIWAFTTHIERAITALGTSFGLNPNPTSPHAQAIIRAREAAMWAERMVQDYNTSFIDRYDPVSGRAHRDGEGSPHFDGPDITIDRVFTEEDVLEVEDQLKRAWHAAANVDSAWGRPHAGCPMEAMINGRSVGIERYEDIANIRNAMLIAISGARRDGLLESLE